MIPHHHRLKVLDRNDVPEVVRVHLSAFRGNALSRMGAEAVRRYYVSLHDGSAFKLTALGVVDGDRLLGFCYGGRLGGSLSNFLRENRWFLAAQLVRRPWLISSPIIRSRVNVALRVLRRMQRRKPVSQQQRRSVPQSFGILAIAVDARLQRSGVGKLLMRKAEEIALESGYRSMQLSVDPRNAAAVAFYEADGWKRSPGKKGWSGRMLKQIAQHADQPCD